MFDMQNIGRMIASARTAHISHLTSFLPFLPQDFVNELAENAYKKR